MALVTVGVQLETAQAAQLVRMLCENAGQNPDAMTTQERNAVARDRMRDWLREEVRTARRNRANITVQQALDAQADIDWSAT